ATKSRKPKIKTSKSVKQDLAVNFKEKDTAESLKAKNLETVKKVKNELKELSMTEMNHKQARNAKLKTKRNKLMHQLKNKMIRKKLMNDQKI
ncbi:MAG: hypothetical protein MHPSP_003085, partial [Paramarteilia canceri]